MRKRQFFILVALLATLIFLIGGSYWWRWATSSPTEPTAPIAKVFVIRRGESWLSFSNRLEKEKLIKNSLAFKLLILTRGLIGKIQAGSFHLNSSMSADQITRVLTLGTHDVWLTFPEGWRKEEYARRLKANLENFNEKEFLDLTENLEGKLFPDTYLIPKDSSPSAVVKILIGNFEKKTGELQIDRPKLILASIVEREVRYDKDRSIVGGILLKRWQNNWFLQADATLQYIVADTKCGGQRECNWWPKVINYDKQIDSAYNTYKYKGLPPAPISNPGLSSIMAVINPHFTDYWFYLSDSSGNIYYARDIEEHNQNIEKYLR